MSCPNSLNHQISFRTSTSYIYIILDALTLLFQSQDIKLYLMNRCHVAKKRKKMYWSFFFVKDLGELIKELIFFYENPNSALRFSKIMGSHESACRIPSFNSAINSRSPT